MNRFSGFSVHLFLSVIMIVIFSCKRNTEEVFIPEYYGGWEREWEDSDYINAVFLRQTIDIGKGKITSVLFQKINNNWQIKIEGMGKYTIIENIVNGEILKLGKAVDQNPITFYKPEDIEFKAILSENLKIGQKFICLQAAMDDKLTLRFDLNGDSIVGNEGAIIFNRIK